jgi:hypothetical protein
LGFDEKVIVTVRTIFICLIPLSEVVSKDWYYLRGGKNEPQIFAKDLFALFATKHHFVGLFDFVVRDFFVAFGTIKPLLATGSTDRNLRVEDVLAHFWREAKVRRNETHRNRPRVKGRILPPTCCS